MSRLLAASLIALTAVGTTFAQDEKQPPRGKGRREQGGGQGGQGGRAVIGGFGQGGGGFGMFGGMSSSYVGVLEMKEVQEDLKLSADEKSNIPLIKEELSEGDKKFGEELRGVDREAMREKFASRKTEIEKQLKEVLGDKFTRFRQIKLQLDGLYAAVTGDKEVQDSLSVSEEQRTQLREALRPPEGGRGGGGGFRFNPGDGPPSEEKIKEMMEEGKKRMEEMSKRQTEALDKVLTADQKKKWEELIGSPIAYKRPAPKMDMRPGGEGGRRRRPGGGGKDAPPPATEEVKPPQASL